MQEAENCGLFTDQPDWSSYSQRAPWLAVKTGDIECGSEIVDAEVNPKGELVMHVQDIDEEVVIVHNFLEAFENAKILPAGGREFEGIVSGANSDEWEVEFDREPATVEITFI